MDVVKSLQDLLKLWVEEASAAKRRRAGVAEDALALEVRGIFGDKVRRAGLKNGDVIVAVGDWTEKADGQQFTQHVALHYYKKGARLPLTVMRGKQRMEFVVEI